MFELDLELLSICLRPSVEDANFLFRRAALILAHPYETSGGVIITNNPLDK